MTRHLTLLVFLYCIAGLPAQGEPTWTRHFPSIRPADRTDAELAWDAANSATLMFGGTTGTLQGDTWLWNGISWTQAASTGPAPRKGHDMAYDPTRQRVVLFGGRRSAGVLADTWEWDGTQWLQAQPTQSPVAREYHTLAWDEN